MTAYTVAFLRSGMTRLVLEHKLQFILIFFFFWRVWHGHGLKLAFGVLGGRFSNGMVHIWVESLQPALFEQRVGKVQQAMDGVFETAIVVKILHSLCIYPLETMFRSVVTTSRYK